MNTLVRKNSSIIILFTVFAVLCLTSLTFAEKVEKKLAFSSVGLLEGKRIGVIDGGVTDKTIQGFNPKIDNFSYFANISDGIIALKANKIDAFCTDSPVAALVTNRSEGVACIDGKTIDDSYGIALKKGNPLYEKIEKAINKLSSEGELKKIEGIWFGADESLKKLPEQTWSGKNGTLSFGGSGILEPMCYFNGKGELVGYDVHCVYLIAKELDMTVSPFVVPFSGLIPALQSGKIDIAVNSLSVTEERKKSVDMVPYYDGTLVFIVNEISDNVKADTDWLSGISSSFRRTFIVEDRWKLVLDGLIVTIFISVGAGILGTLLGFTLYFLRATGNKFLEYLVIAVIKIIQGVPIVVILMILYYVVFGKVDIDPIWVAIIGFGINYGVYTSEMIRTGIEAVDMGQYEAALALGYSPVISFFKVVLPQAARHFLPVMKGEFIGMVKMTSVVGYIAGQDLTKATDIIRSRTMEAFFPLIATAIIYFIIANVLAFALTKIEISIDPKQRNRQAVLV